MLQHHSDVVVRMSFCLPPSTFEDATCRSWKVPGWAGSSPPPPRQVNELGRGVAATVPWETCRQQITLPGWATTLLPLCGQRSGCWELSESCSQQVLEGTVDILGCITAPLPSSLSREKGGCHAGLDNYPSLRGKRSKQVCWKAQLSCWAGLGWAGLSLDLTEQL